MGNGNNVTNSQQSSNSALWTNLARNLRNIDRTGLNLIKNSAKRYKELMTNDGTREFPSLGTQIIFSPISVFMSTVAGAVDTITEDVVPSAKQVYYTSSALMSDRETVVLEDGIYYKNGNHVFESLDGTKIITK